MSRNLPPSEELKSRLSASTLWKLISHLSPWQSPPRARPPPTSPALLFAALEPVTARHGKGVPPQGLRHTQSGEMGEVPRKTRRGREVGQHSSRRRMKRVGKKRKDQWSCSRSHEGRREHLYPTVEGFPAFPAQHREQTKRSLYS